MASDEPSGARPSPVVLRIKLRYEDVDTMVQRFAANVGRAGLFLPTKSIQPIDTEVKFELRLANDAPVVIGLGRVKASRAPDPANPRLQSGITVELMRVTRDSRDVIMRMLERRKELQLPDLALPMPADIDAARRPDSEVAVPRAATDVPSAPVAMVAVPSGPVVGVVSGPVGPIVAAEPSNPVLAPMTTPVSTPVLTAPRAMAGARDYGIKPLAPEPTKRPRPRISELIAKSSGPTAAPAVDDVDADVDVASALARARALAGGDLDQELEALANATSAPREISIEAASAELAKQLGGSAVRRDRSARIAPPPTVAEGTAQRPTVAAAIGTHEIAAPDVDARAESVSEVAPPPVPSDATVEAASIEAPSDEAASIEAPSIEAPSSEQHVETAPPSIEPAHVPTTEPSTLDVALSALDSELTPRPQAPPKARTQPLPRMKPLAPLSSIAPLPAEPTFLKTEPAKEPEAVAEWDNAGPTSTEPPSPLVEARAKPKSTRPQTPDPVRATTADIAEAVSVFDEGGVDVLVTPAQPEAALEPLMRPSSSSMDAAIDDAIDAAMLHTPAPDDGPAAEITPLPHEVVHQLSELDMEDVEHTNVGAAPDTELAGQLDRHLDDAEREAESDLQAAISEASVAAQPIDEEFEIEEVSDFEIIAEADADDADLLLADGERDASQDAAAPYTPPPDDPPLRPSQDFASRLDLGDDDFDEPRPPPSTVTPSAGYALSAFDDQIPERHASYDEEEPLDFDRPSERYRYPDRRFPEMRRANFDSQPAPEDEFDERPNYGETAIQPPPAVEFDEPHAGFGQPRYESEPAVAQEPSHDVELERTLSALDVDLDELSLPHARPLTPSPASNPRTRTPSGPVATARTKQPTPSAQPIPAETPVASTGRIHRRASTEDGILIDFDDDPDD